MSPQKRDKKLPIGQRCGIFLIMLVFAAIAGFLGLTALEQSDSICVPQIFAYIPLGIAALVTLAAVCILAGVWNPKSASRTIVRPMYV